MASIITTPGFNQINSTNASLNASGGNYIQYNFTSIPNVSKVGKYTGTGAAGNYVECGFKPAWLMVKNLTTGSTDWLIADSIRGEDVEVRPNLSNAEASAERFDFYNNGFACTSNATASNGLNDEYLFLAFAETSTDATKAWTDYEYATSQDTLSIQQNTLLSFANGFSSSGQVDTQENVGAGVTYSLGAGYENKHLWLYKDKGGSYGVTEHRPLEGTSRNQADKWGVQSPLDASLRTTAKHFDYESETGVVLASGDDGANFAWGAFDKDSSDILLGGWSTTATTTSWLQYKFNEKRILKSWRLREGADVTQTPDNFTIEGSNDGLNWTVIDNTYATTDFDTVTNGARLWSPLQDTSANTTAYLYHRINITANNGNGTYTTIIELEFNTVLPSDYYLINEGVMYDSTGTPIERIYLAELMTNDDGEVSSYTNLPVAKQKITEAEVQQDLLVHGEIANRGICTAWVNFDGTQNPPLIRDSYNVKDVVDLGTGYYAVYFENPMDSLAYSVTASANTNSASVGSGNIKEITHTNVYIRDNTNTAQNVTDINVTFLGGKDVR